MSTDRFVRWGDERPDGSGIRILLEDYVGKAAEVTVGVGGRLFVNFPSPSSWALRRTLGRDMPIRDERRTLGRDMPIRDERWFEVFISDDSVDIITREQDEFVGNIASGFARLCARTWGGELEMEGA